MSLNIPKIEEEAAPMTRLPFVLPDFMRIAWVNEKARTVWAERITGINKMHAYLEWASVVAGLRRCGLQMLDESQLTERPIALRSHGLELTVLKKVNAVSSYQSRISDATSGRDCAYWCVAGVSHHIAEFREAFDGSDNVTMGRLLGYPECCIDFFEDFWVKRGLVDSTWLSALSTSSASMAGRLVTCTSSKCSVLLRWIGVRSVFHLPCAFDCAMSASIAVRLASIAQDYRFVDEMRWLSELISMPMEWSALHGIAEIKTPLFKIVTNTDATAQKHVVRIDGTHYPTEGASGVVFPFRVKQKEPTQKFQAAVEFVELSASVTGEPIKPVNYRDNGFTTNYAMERAHSPLVQECNLLLSKLNNGKQNVLDLGCGNGMLLRKIAILNSDVAIAGIDCDSHKIERAIDLNHGYKSTFISGNMFDIDMLEHHFGSRIGVCIIMLGRLTEVTSESAVRLLDWIGESAEKVLVYAYNDYLRNGTSLNSLADTLEIQLGTVTDTDSVSFATICTRRKK